MILLLLDERMVGLNSQCAWTEIDPYIPYSFQQKRDENEINVLSAFYDPLIEKITDQVAAI